MDLWDLTRLLLRRWYFAVPMLVATVAVVVLAARTVSPDYKATGYMQLIPAQSTGKTQDPKAKPRPANPWLDLGYSALGNAAVITVTDQKSLDRLKKEGYTDSVTIVLDQQTPLLDIEAVGNSPQQASSTVQEVIKLLQADIATKQKQYGALPEDTISTLVINDGSTPSVESGKVKRILIVAAGLGLIITTASTIALDYWLRRRARRRNGEDAGDDSVARPTPMATRAANSAPGVSLESAERTRVLHPQRSAPPMNGNGGDKKKGSVYSGQKVETNGRAPGSSATTATEAPVDATIVLPTSQPARRSADNLSRRPQDNPGRRSAENRP